MRLWMCVVELPKSTRRGKGWCVSWVAPPVFSFIFAELGQHRKWEGVAIFFGIVALGSRKPILAQDGHVGWERWWISMIGALKKLHQNCLTFATTSLGMLLPSFCFGGHALHKIIKRFLEG